MAAAPEVGSEAFAEDGKQRIVGGVRIRDRLLRHALKQRSRILVARHAQEWRFQEADGLVSGNRRQVDVHLVRGEEAGIPNAKNRLIVDAESQSGAGRERELLRIPHARMAAAW